MSALNLNKIHDTLVTVAFEAGRMMATANPYEIIQDTKLNSADIVTECDKAVEGVVIERLKAAYPDFLFVGEETYVAGETKITPSPTFIVDPIDGTTNFVHGFPDACISLGFAVDRAPVVGVIYNPFRDELWTAIRGRGAYLQRNASMPPALSPTMRLPLSCRGNADAIPPPLTSLSTSLIAIEWGSTRDGPIFDLKNKTFRRLAGSELEGGAMVHGFRSLGSAAMNLCAVAAGQLDAYWEGGCYAWDVAAGWCILAEAGGVMAGGNPGEWKPQLDSRVYLAVRGARSGQREFVEDFWKVIGEGERMDYQH